MVEFFFFLNAKFKKVENDSCELPFTSSLPKSSFALFDFEVVIFKGL